MLGFIWGDNVFPFDGGYWTESKDDPRRSRSLESRDCFSSGNQAATAEESRVVGTSTRSASSSIASFRSSSTPTAETAAIPKLLNCVLGWSTLNHARASASSQIAVCNGA